jgi:hypothetical protein
MNSQRPLRTPRNSASISSFSRTTLGSSVTGRLRLMTRVSTNIIGRNMKPLEKGHGCRGFLQELSGPAQDGPLDRAHVADQFASRPAPFGRPRFPLPCSNGICGAQKFASCASKVIDDGRK